MSDTLTPDTPPIEATHILDGVLLIQKLNKKGKPYYINVETAKVFWPKPGAIPEPLETPEGITPEDDPHQVPESVLDALLEAIRAEYEGEPELPADLSIAECVEMGVLPFEAYVVAVACFANPFGWIHRGKLGSRKINENEIVFTYPDAEGNDLMTVIQFPDSVTIHTRPYDGE